MTDPNYSKFIAMTPAAFFGKEPMRMVVDYILVQLKVQGVPLITINLDELNQLFRADFHSLLVKIVQELVQIWKTVPNAVLFFTLSGTYRKELRKAISDSSSAQPAQIFLPLLTLQNFSDIFVDLVKRCLEPETHKTTVSPALQMLLAAAAGNPRLLSLLISLLSLVGKDLNSTTGQWREPAEYDRLQFDRDGLRQFHEKTTQLEQAQVDALLDGLHKPFMEVIRMPFSSIQRT